jgi:hypothetical protein
MTAWFKVKVFPVPNGPNTTSGAEVGISSVVAFDAATSDTMA